jgi:hypothetical protein
VDSTKREQYLLLFGGLVLALLLPAFASRPEILQSGTVQRLLEGFYSTFNTGIESSFSKLALGEFARLTFAIEWTLMPLHAILWFLYLRRHGGPGILYFLSFPLWKSFIWINGTTLVFLAVCLHPTFDVATATGDSLGSQLTRWGYTGPVQFAILFSLMSWAAGFCAAALAVYWRWVAFPKLMGSTERGPHS